MVYYILRTSKLHARQDPFLYESNTHWYSPVVDFSLQYQSRLEKQYKSKLKFYFRVDRQYYVSYV